ncbi:MAG: hypothetical protein JW722_04815 [Demequinaceae bacterium]|nr:hypothetical protein [Demequinaceae bacterium]
MVLASQDVDSSRRAARTITHPGTARFHSVHENPARKRHALRVLQSAPMSVLIVESAADTPRRHDRSKALIVVTKWCVANGVSRLVLERDDSHVHADRRLIRESTMALPDERRMEYYHLRSREEPLLWFADLIAWCWSRGGEWHDLALTLEPTVIRVP